MRAPLVALLLLFGSFDAGADARLGAALKLLDAHEQPADEDDAALAKWSAGGRDLWVVAAIYDAALIRAAVLRETRHGFELVARSAGEEPIANEPQIYVSSLKLDLIPYRISPNDVAFGVRVGNSFSSTARSSYSEALHLYRLHVGKLTQVFAELTTDSNYEVPDDENAEGEETLTEQVVIVSRTMHKGFYDLLLRDRETKETITYRWDGAAYARE